MRFKIVDTTKNEMVANFRVKDQNIIGKILSHNYTVIGGFIYFNNQVIKIRYDQILEKRSEILDSNLAFDQYDQILDLKNGQEVTVSPLVSRLLHRQAYMTRNFEFQKTYKVIVLPYLHERKIYMNKMKKNQEYFYVTLTIDPHVDQIMHDMHKGRFHVDENDPVESEESDGGIFEVAKLEKEPVDKKNTMELVGLENDEGILQKIKNKQNKKLMQIRQNLSERNSITVDSLEPNKPNVFKDISLDTKRNNET